MMYLEDDKLIIQFPELDEGAGVRIDLKRTLRIPDNGGLHALSRPVPLRIRKYFERTN